MNTLCPYCGYEFNDLDAHVPCPEGISDTHPDFGVPVDQREED